MKQFVTIVPSKERQHSENSFTWCFGANTISSVQKQGSTITKSCYFQIRNIERNRSYTSEDECKTLVCSLVTSRLDYGNALICLVKSSITISLCPYSWLLNHHGVLLP
jgi:hypothetical protein